MPRRHEPRAGLLAKPRPPPETRATQVSRQLTAFALALCLAVARPAAAGEAPARILELAVRVAGARADTTLRVEATAAFEAPAGAEAVVFRLLPEHPLWRVLGEDGRTLDYHRRGEHVVVQGPAGAATRRWTFEYSLALFQRVEEIDAFFSNTGWLPGEPAADGAPAPATWARVEVELPEPLVALVPGESSVEALPAGRRYRFRGQAASHPLVLGRLALRERRQEGLAARVLVPASLAGRAEELLDLLLGSAAFYSRSFGPVRGDFALAALPLGPGQRGITFPGLVVLAAADVADPAVFSARILAHEVAHHWWSLSVGFPDPRDAWLAEGLPTYSALLFLEESRGSDRLREELRNSRATALSSPDAPALRVGAAMKGGARYTQTYHKAACVLHMLRETLGREPMLALLRGLHAEFAGRALASEGFFRAASRAASADLARFFRGWVERPGTPRYEVVWEVEPDPGGEGASVSGTIRRRGVDVEATARLRVVHADGRATEARVRLAADETRFRIPCPEPALELAFDPGGDLLHAGATVRRERR